MFCFGGKVHTCAWLTEWLLWAHGHSEQTCQSGCSAWPFFKKGEMAAPDMHCDTYIEILDVILK